MDVLTFLKEYSRMCNSYISEWNCNGCPRETEPTCEITDLGPEGIKKLINDVDQWSKEHPLRTRLQDFRGKYPNAEVYPDGQPVICCARLGYRKYCGKSFDDNHEGFNVCFNCWNMPVEEDDE